MRYTIRLFGPCRVTAGQDRLDVEVHAEKASCGQLREALGGLAPRLAPLLPACRFAVNRVLVGDEHRADPSDEIALIGLVSGG